MKISIIVPVYNVEKYLSKCLDSLVTQTIDDYEVIVVNDGSTDRSREIIEDFLSRYPERIVALETPNAGQGHARNLALQIAKGDFLGFVDSDDWIDKNMYRAMYEIAMDKDADIVVCDMVDYFESGEVLYHHSSEFTDPLTVSPSACNKIFKKSLVGETAFPTGLWYEDFDFTTKLILRAKKIACIHEGFYCCHCRSGSTMLNHNSVKNLDIITVIEDLKEYIASLPNADSLKGDFEYMVLEHILLTSINRVYSQQNPQKKQVIRQMRQYVKENVPSLTKSQGFQRSPYKRKIIMFLNYYGLEAVSKAILSLKQRARS